jgi:hypothetical protein
VPDVTHGDTAAFCGSHTGDGERGQDVKQVTTDAESTWAAKEKFAAVRDDESRLQGEGDTDEAPIARLGFGFAIPSDSTHGEEAEVHDLR